MTTLLLNLNRLAKIILLVCVFPFVACAQEEDPTLVKTTQGYLRGFKEDSALVFKGIPYAEAPVGELRFTAPIPKRKWTDTLSCTQFGQVAMQFDGGKKQPKGDENCLSLNVYTPTTKAKSGLPVVVWVHGGSMTSGSGSGMNGHAFADADSVVTVTINYRLGVFGFLYLGDVNKKYKTSGNNGLQDLMLSLKWIKENIKAFGGDPKRVTVMGESAGAKLTSTLLLTPKAQQLYAQLVLESGGVQCVRDTITAKAIRSRLLKVLNLKTAAELLNLSADQLITAQNMVCNGAQGTNYFGPVEDGHLLSGDPYQYVAKKTGTKKRFLIGSNKVEAKLFMDMDKRLYSPESGTVLTDWFGNNDHYVLEDFKRRTTLTGADSAAKTTLSEYMYIMHSHRLANALATKNENVYVYRFDYSKDNSGASHAAELAYVWHLPKQRNPSILPELAIRMHKNWVDFIRGSAPASDWPAYSKDQKPIQVFNYKSTLDRNANVFNDPGYPSAGFILQEAL